MDESVSSDSIKEDQWFMIRYGTPGELRRLLAASGPLNVLLSDEEQTELLFDAIRSKAWDGLERLEVLLEAGCNPNCIENPESPGYQKTPFTAAAGEARLDMMKKLVAAGADIHWSSPIGSNAASEAMPFLAGQAQRIDSPARREVMAWLADHGVHMNPDCEDSRRKLQWASFWPESWPDIPMLLALGVNAAGLGWTPLMMKIAMGEAGPADVEKAPAEDIERYDGLSRTPFLLCITAGRRDLAEMLLSRGANPHAKGRLGVTAMHVAARFAPADFIDWLAGLGVPVDMEDHQRHRPLECAVEADQVEAASRLLALGAEVNATDDCNRRVIHSVRSASMMKLLLRAGAGVNDVSGTGNWPLMIACCWGDASLVQFLLDLGAVPDLNLSGETALFCAVEADALDCVRALLNAGANVNALDCDEWPCLRLVQSQAMARLLLERGADPSIRISMGRLPEDYVLPEIGRLFKNARLSDQPQEPGTPR